MKELKNILCKRGFIAQVCENKTDALECALQIIGNSSVGFGGSVTVNSIGLYDVLKDQGNEVHWHWKDEDKDLAKKLSSESDFFVCSANAVTENGLICNMDGTGNRCASLIYGPGSVILFVGKNKIVKGLDDVMPRIKESAIANAKRLGSDLPCVKTGHCVDCSSPNRSCNVLVIHERPPKSMKAFHVLLVNEDLGL